MTKWRLGRAMRWKLNRAELIVIVVVWLGLAGLFWPIFMNGPAGPMVPPFLDDATHRLRNATGLSIILPKRWICLQNNEMGLHLCPKTPFASRSRATMGLNRLETQPDVTGYTQVPFKDCDAWELMRIERKFSFDDGALSVFRLVIQHPTGWVEFSYTIARETQTLPDSIRQYIQSIEIASPSDVSPTP